MVNVRIKPSQEALLKTITTDYENCSIATIVKSMGQAGCWFHPAADPDGGVPRNSQSSESC